MRFKLIHSDVRDGLAQIEDASVQTVVTSPPYWGLRDYGVAGQIGLEATPDAFVARLVDAFRDVRRVLKHDGTLWLNLGDSYASDTKGSGGPNSASTLVGTKAEDNGQKFLPRKMLHGLKQKDLVGIPWMVAFALRADGWYLRADIIWNKPNPMPESVTDRPTKAHEYLFLLTKSPRYFYDAEAIKEPGVSSGTRKMPDGWDTGAGAHGSFHREGREKGRTTDKQRGHSRRHGFNDRWDAMEREEQCSGRRNKRSVWTVATQPFPEAHFATFPEDLIEPCILAGSRVGDTVLDPFNGSGTTGVVSLKHQRDYVGIELNADYLAMARRRLLTVAPLFTTEDRATLPA